MGGVLEGEAMSAKIISIAAPRARIEVPPALELRLRKCAERAQVDLGLDAERARWSVEALVLWHGLEALEAGAR
jgi:hypothetical protein